MADLSTSANPLFLREEELRRGIELLFFAYRDFTKGPDKLLTEHRLGRAHHRVLYFIGRNPGIMVSRLLGILRITKQSLSRVLGQLVEQGLVSQEKGRQDRRQRLLYLTELGLELEKRLSDLQRDRFARAYRDAGADAVAGYRRVLLGLVDQAERDRILALIEGG